MDEWEETISQFRTLEKEKVPSVVKRCPKCKKLTLEFDPEKGRIACTACGFEYFLEMQQ